MKNYRRREGDWLGASHPGGATALHHTKSTTCRHFYVLSLPPPPSSHLLQSFPSNNRLNKPFTKIYKYKSTKKQAQTPLPESEAEPNKKNVSTPPDPTLLDLVKQGLRRILGHTQEAFSPLPRVRQVEGGRRVDGMASAGGRLVGSVCDRRAGGCRHPSARKSSKMGGGGVYLSVASRESRCTQEHTERVDLFVFTPALKYEDGSVAQVRSSHHIVQNQI